MTTITHAEPVALETVLDEFRRITRLPNTFLAVYRQDASALQLVAADGPQASALQQHSKWVPVPGDRYIQRVLEAGEVGYLEDARLEQGVNEEIVDPLSTRTIICAPLVIADRVYGILGAATFGEQVQPLSQSEVRGGHEFAENVSLDLAYTRLMDCGRDDGAEYLGHDSSDAAKLIHDLRTLLTAATATVELLMEDVHEEDDKADLHLLLDVHERADALLESYLARACRPERGCDPKQVIEGLAPILRRLLGAEVRLDTRVDRSCPCVSIDAVGVERLLLNIAANAAEAMCSGGRLRIEAEPSECGGGSGVRMTFVDSGPGFSPVALQRGFEPCFTTREHSGGSGLGLALCSQLVSEAGGSIRLRNALEGGAVVEVILPSL